MTTNVSAPSAPRPYKVLIVDLARTFGGAEVRALTQAAALQTVTAGCAVATLRGSPLHEQLQRRNLPHEVINSGRASPQLLLTLRGIMRRGNYGIIDAHNVQSILWGHLAAALAGGRGCVATIHSDYGAEYPGLKGKFYEAVLRVDQFVARQYINVTEVLQAKAERQGLGPRSTLIHNAVVVPPSPDFSKDPALLASFGFTPDDFVVAIVARLKPVKGHTTLIDAFTRLSDLPHAKLLVVGDGPLRPELEAQVQRCGLAGRVHFTGFREDIPHILPSVDCVAMASLSEALPYAVLEACSYARPLVATAVGGLVTLLKDGETALLVPSQNPDAMAEAIRRLVENPAEARRIGLAGYEMVKRSFSVESMIEKILRVYDAA